MQSIKEPNYIPDEHPNFIEDYFVLGNRTYIKLKTSPTAYFVIDTEKNICEKVIIKEHKRKRRTSRRAKN